MLDHRKNLVKGIAAERIEILFGLAEQASAQDPERSRKYVAELRRIGSHYKVKLPKPVRNSICRSCNSVLIPGVTARIRLASVNRQKILTCMNCKAEKRVRY